MGQSGPLFETFRATVALPPASLFSNLCSTFSGRPALGHPLRRSWLVYWHIDKPDKAWIPRPWLLNPMEPGPHRPSASSESACQPGNEVFNGRLLPAIQKWALISSTEIEVKLY